MPEAHPPTICVSTLPASSSTGRSRPATSAMPSGGLGALTFTRSIVIAQERHPRRLRSGQTCFRDKVLSDYSGDGAIPYVPPRPTSWRRRDNRLPRRHPDACSRHQPTGLGHDQGVVQGHRHHDQCFTLVVAAGRPSPSSHMDRPISGRSGQCGRSLLSTFHRARPLDCHRVVGSVTGCRRHGMTRGVHLAGPSVQPCSSSGSWAIPAIAAGHVMVLFGAARAGFLIWLGFLVVTGARLVERLARLTADIPPKDPARRGASARAGSRCLGLST